MKAVVSSPIRSFAADDAGAVVGTVVVGTVVVGTVVIDDDVVLGGDAIGVCYIKHTTMYTRAQNEHLKLVSH